MDFLTQIKSTISAKTVDNLASFLGEKPSDVESGFGLSVNSFMAGLLKYAHSDIELKNILNVLNDGGHTGDILNNLESFSGNFEKTQLLVTIGNNIVTHFLGNKTSLIVDKISGISETKKTSSTSLLSLSAPIVLGFIGKTVKEKNLDVAGLRNHFRDINSSVINALPPAISNIFQFKKLTNEVKETKTIKEKVEKVEKVKTSKSDGIRWGVILPWIFLALAGLGVLYYAKFRKPKAEVAVETPVFKEKEEKLIPQDFLPDSTVANLPPEKSVVPVNVEKVEKPTESETTQTPTNQIKKVEDKTKIKTSESNPTKNQPKDVKPIVEKAKVPEPKTKQVEQVNSTTTTSSLPSGWNSVSGNVFRKNSAEITNASGISSIVSSLRNNSKKIRISPLSEGNRTLGEDRAYALKDKLIEKGIDPERIEIGSTQKGSNPNGIAYRISN